MPRSDRYFAIVRRLISSPRPRSKPVMAMSESGWAGSSRRMRSSISCCTATEQVARSRSERIARPRRSFSRKTPWGVSMYRRRVTRLMVDSWTPTSAAAMLDQERQVVEPLAERRHPEHDPPEPVVEVLAEATRPGLAEQFL
jgi:hypothetical protein